MMYVACNVWVGREERGVKKLEWWWPKSEELLWNGCGVESGYCTYDRYWVQRCEIAS